MSGDGEPGDGIYGGEIPGRSTSGNVDYYVTATDNLGASAADPRDAPATLFTYEVGFVPPPLVVNEFMALNETTIQDEWGEFDDWVEIYNHGSEPIALGGLRLSDNFAIPDKYVFPDTMLGAGDFLIIWCDNDPGQGRWHADFRLSADGEELGIFGDPVSGFAPVDTVTFGVQYPDTSMARHPDAGPDWQLDPEPTPGWSNTGVGVEEAEPAPPRVTSLGPVAPNPFMRRLSGALDIPFALPDRRRVTVTVYDASGRAVARLADQVFESGRHRVTWDGSGIDTRRIASGVYFLRMTAGAELYTTKITLLR
jgi:hypothetical protein